MKIQHKALMAMIPEQTNNPREVLDAISQIADCASSLHVASAASLISVTAQCATKMAEGDERDDLLRAAREVVDVAVDGIVTGIRRSLQPLIDEGKIPDPWGTKSHNDQLREQILGEMEGGK